MTRRAKTLLLAISGGIVAGALDIAYAWAFWAIKAGVSFERILQSVASGVLGLASFEGGTGSALLGFLLHFGMAVAMSLAYVLAAARYRTLVQHPLACGALYGLCLYALMHYLVVPLSASGGSAPDPWWTGLTIVAHVVFVGIPIAWFAKRALQAPAH